MTGAAEPGALVRTRAERLAAYLRLAAERPELFAGPCDGVRLVLEPERIAQIEEELGRRYLARGADPAWAGVGVCYQDPYLCVLRDAVVFLDGSTGVHHRAVRFGGDPSGVAVLAISQGGVLLLRHFRHPLRGWSWEIPRGAIEAGADPQATVRIELFEEAEATVTGIEPLGRVFGATGFMGLSVLLYAARLEGFGRPALNEGVGEVRVVTVQVFEEMVKAGEIVDSFTLAAFLHARLRGLV